MNAVTRVNGTSREPYPPTTVSFETIPSRAGRSTSRTRICTTSGTKPRHARSRYAGGWAGTTTTRDNETEWLENGRSAAREATERSGTNVERCGDADGRNRQIAEDGRRPRQRRVVSIVSALPGVVRLL